MGKRTTYFCDLCGSQIKSNASLTEGTSFLVVIDAGGSLRPEYRFACELACWSCVDALRAAVDSIRSWSPQIPEEGLSSDD